MGTSGAVGDTCMIALNSKLSICFLWRLPKDEQSPRQIFNVKNGSLEIWGISALVELLKKRKTENEYAASKLPLKLGICPVIETFFCAF